MPKFQARHYTTIADLLVRDFEANVNNLFGRPHVEYLIGLFAQMFATDNPRFKLSRFMAACQARKDAP